jgi:radical SAM superfamily enzyme YgiQ (UPF0313 family)
MKVTFITPYYHNVWEPLGLAYLIAYCKKHVPEIDVKFCHGNFDSSYHTLWKAVTSDVVAFSATSPTYKNALEVAHRIKQHPRNKTKIVLGGWHVTAMEDKNFDHVDHVVSGEGETAMRSILWGDKRFHVPGRPMDFEELMWPDREAIKQERHLDQCYKMCGLRIASFQSRRGCPMNCAFCSEHCMSGEYGVRVRDPEDLLDEIDSVYTNYKIDMFKFLDPTWVHPVKAAYDFCEAKIRRKNHLPWEAMGHAAFLTKDLLKLMKSANCKQINVGVESGSQKILNDMRKGVTVSKIKKVFKWCHELNLEVRGFFLIGMPNDSLKTAGETWDLAKEIKPDMFGMTILCPYPGTDFYNPVKHKNVNWARADEYGNDFWETKHLCNADLKRVQRVFAKGFKDKLAPHMKEIMKL